MVENNLTLLSSPSTGTTARASSVLQKNFKTYGPMNALKTDDTSSCWYSDGTEGDSQFFIVNFNRLVEPKQLKLQYQAGFAGESCQLELLNKNCGSSEII